MHRRLASSLDEAAWTPLSATPLVVELPEHGVRIVHAGLVPGVRIEHQARRTLMTIRSLGPDGRPSDRSNGPAWGTRYHGPVHVVFGHHAQPEPQIHPFATGIDTGCVYGGTLTAMVLRDGERPPRSKDRRDALVTVPARREWFAGRGHR
jgi:diadenosine tetraphosphatase ApaH/serine/threonine PP2A family protein phosphatase